MDAETAMAIWGFVMMAAELLEMLWIYKVLSWWLLKMLCIYIILSWWLLNMAADSAVHVCGFMMTAAEAAGNGINV